MNRWLDDWSTDADRDEGWPRFLAAAAVLTLWAIVGYLYLVTFAVAA